MGPYYITLEIIYLSLSLYPSHKKDPLETFKNMIFLNNSWD